MIKSGDVVLITDAGGVEHRATADTWTYRTAAGLTAEQEIRVEALHAATRVVESTTSPVYDVEKAVLDAAERFADWIENGERASDAEEQPGRP